MKSLRNVFVILFALGLLAAVAAAQSKKSKRPMRTKITKKTDAPLKPPTNAAADFKILAAGAMSRVEEPFAFVARDAATYELLKNIAPELPPAQTIDFKQTAIVAAFLGTKPTGGFDLTIQKAASGVRVRAVNPARDQMLIQVLTAPFKIALVPQAEDETLPLELGSEWTRAAQTFRLTSGAFTFSGGFRPIKQKFAVGGTVDVLQNGDLITLIFDVSGKTSATARRMNETASGRISNNNLTLARVEPGGLIDPPHPALRAAGTLDGKNLALSFESLPTNIADGYTGSGSLIAVKKGKSEKVKK